MKVALITLLKEGGMVHYSSQLANHLVERINVDLIVPEDCNVEYFNNNINIHTIKTPSRGKWMSKEQFNIIKLFRIINKINLQLSKISCLNVFLG